jgi:hypothetical protein
MRHGLTLKIKQTGRKKNSVLSFPQFTPGAQVNRAIQWVKNIMFNEQA